jgi:hypothetical protein
MPVPLLNAMVSWCCPNCWITASSPPLPPGTRKFHVCPGLHGLTAPLAEAGVRCQVTAEERQPGSLTRVRKNRTRPWHSVRQARSSSRRC